MCRREVGGECVMVSSSGKDGRVVEVGGELL